MSGRDDRPPPAEQDAVLPASVPQIVERDPPPAIVQRPPDRLGFSLRSLLTAAFFHKRLILLAALVPVVLGSLAAWKSRPEYTASSLLMVLVNREYSASQNVTDSGPAVLSIEGLKSVESELQIIESADVILATVEEIGAARLFPKRDNPVERYVETSLAPFRRAQDPSDQAIALFRQHLRTSVESGSNVVRVDFTHEDRSVAVEANNTIVQNYLKRRRLIFNNPSSAILQREVDRFGADLKALDMRVQEAKARNDVVDIAQDIQLATNQVDTIKQRRRQVQERQAAVTAQLGEAERQLSDLPATVFDFAERSNETGGAAGSADSARDILTRLLVDRDRIALQYAPDNPRLREIDQKIETVRQQLRSAADTSEPTAGKTEREVRNPAIGYLGNMVLSLRVERDSLGRQVEELDKQQPASQARIDALRIAETEILELNRERDSLGESYRDYLRRAVAAQIEETAAEVRSSNVRSVQSADTAVVGRSLRLPLLAAGLIGSLLFGAAAGTAAAVVRSTFIHPDEAERALQLPLLAEFGRAKDPFSDIAGAQVLSALAARIVDTRIDGEPLRLLQFASPDGKGESRPFARALAAELSAAQRCRTLLLEAGAADTAERGDRSETAGLTIRATDFARLSKADPSDSPLFNLRLPIQHARDTLAELRRAHDIVLIFTDSPRELQAMLRLAPLVDANIVMIRAETTRAPVTVHLRDVLLSTGAGLLGFVFTDRKYYIPRWIYRRI